MKQIPKRVTKNPLPRYWKKICPEAVSRFDVSFRGCSISTKVLVFYKLKDAKAFMWRQFRYRWHRDCAGLFYDVSQDVYDYTNGKPIHYHEVDPRYIGVICLLADKLRLEIIAHECCHAGIAYSRRLNKQWPDVGHCPDEAICYPVGKLVAQICSALKESGHEIIGNHGIMH